MKRSLEEMCRLVTGRGMWHLNGIHLSDGPHGLRTQDDRSKNNDSYEATCFPSACAQACSWDKELIYKMARGIAKEAKELGVSIVLGPGINIKRSPMCGRNFEYYSEDPCLTGELASAYVSGMQENGVGTSLKHFAANNQETHRMTSNSMIDDRALHEIYLSAFEKVAKEAKPATIMASYNYINGVSGCENSYLLTDILRNKWGYKGAVISDWGACVDLEKCIKAGMDIEMPDSCGNHYNRLLNAVKSDETIKENLIASVSRIEKLCNKYRINDVKEKCVSNKTRKENHDLVCLIEEESAILLKNDDYLPLKNAKEVLIIGDLAIKPRYQGGGSSHINTKDVNCFKEEFEKYGLKVNLCKGYKSSTFSVNDKLEQEAIKEVKKANESNIPIIFVGGLTDMAEGEGYDRDNFDLPANQTSLLKKLLNITDKIAFISISGSPYNMEYPSKCKALLQMYLGGEAVAKACARIVMGEVNPSGKLAETIPYSEKDASSYGNFGKQGKQINHLDDVEYRESIFIGYRYYDTYNIPVRYCFGHGLSYTKFEYSNLNIKKINDKYHISFDVKNIGEVKGKEIVQVYVKNPVDTFRADKELRGFKKVLLNPNEEKKIEILLDERAFCVYQNNDFEVIKGKYEIEVGSSLNDIRLSKEINVEGKELLSSFNRDTKIPLAKEDFYSIYKYPITSFSNLKPGEFTTKNSLIQMAPYSKLARNWIEFGKLVTRLSFFTKPINDPEARMMLEGIIEGNIDCVCNQSGGIINNKTINKIVDSANRGNLK